MGKPVIKFKTYRQSDRVGGKIYGVPNLADPVVADVTMQEVIDYAKLHNYSAATLAALLSQVIASVGDLVARDGRPRMLSDLLKFEPVIKGTFDNLEQTVTSQKVLVRPRMLKEIKVKLDASDYSWQNQNDTTAPRVLSIAPLNTTYGGVSMESFLASIGNNPFGWSFSGNRLFPNGYDSTASFQVIVEQDTRELHFEKFVPAASEQAFGAFEADTDSASANSFDITETNINASYIAWTTNQAGEKVAVPYSELALATGDKVIFRVIRQSGTGEMFGGSKVFVL